MTNECRVVSLFQQFHSTGWRADVEWFCYFDDFTLQDTEPACGRRFKNAAEGGFLLQIAPPTSFPAAHLYKKGSDASVASLICSPCSKPHAKMLCSPQFIRPHHSPPRHPSARRIFDEPEVRHPRVYRRGEAGGGRKAAEADMPKTRERRQAKLRLSAQICLLDFRRV